MFQKEDFNVLSAKNTFLVVIDYRVIFSFAKKALIRSQQTASRK
jgi:hypothetical protein